MTYISHSDKSVDRLAAQAYYARMVNSEYLVEKFCSSCGHSDIHFDYRDHLEKYGRTCGHAGCKCLLLPGQLVLHAHKWEPRGNGDPNTVYEVCAICGKHEDDAQGDGDLDDE